MDDWNVTNNRFIAYFDIMGFKDFVYSNDHDEVLKKMDFLATEIIKPIDKIANEISTGVKSIYSSTTNAVKPIIFSDSILLISEGKNPDDIQSILDMSVFLLAMCFKRSIPINGVISHGLFTADFNKSLYFGKPLIESYLLQKELMYYGCICDHHVEKIINEHPSNKYQLIHYPTPFKSGDVTHLNLNWIEYLKGCGSTLPKEFYIKLVEQFYFSVSGNPRKYVDNTLNFIKYCCRNMP
jgi:hypothetical protein